MDKERSSKKIDRTKSSKTILRFKIIFSILGVLFIFASSYPVKTKEILKKTAEKAFEFVGIPYPDEYKYHEPVQVEELEEPKKPEKVKVKYPKPKKHTSQMTKKELEEFEEQAADYFYREFEFTEAEQITVGKYISDAVNKEFTILENSDSLRVKNLVEKLSKFRNNQESPIHVYTIDSKEKKIFSTIGGHIWISKGLLGLAKTDDELASILAHEISHIDQKHVNINVTNFYRIFQKEDSLKVDRLNLLISSIPLQRYPVEIEKQTDVVALELAYQAGYNPEKFLELIQKWKDGKNSKSKYSYSRSHPISDDRLEEIVKIANEQKRVKTLDSSILNTIVNKLMNLDADHYVSFFIILGFIGSFLYMFKKEFKKVRK
jgi:beta-barrel assembly-enhancing protease